MVFAKNPTWYPMTSRQRILAAIAHQEPDRVPVAPRIHIWLDEYYHDSSLAAYLRLCDEFGGDAFHGEGPSMPTYARRWPDEYDLPDVRVHVDRATDEDGCAIVARVFHTPAGRLSDRVRFCPPCSHWGYSPDPQYLDHLVKTPDDFAAMPYLLAPVRTDFAGYHRAEEMVGERGVVEVYLPGLLGLRAADWRGMEALMLDFHDNRAFFDAQIDFAGRRMMDETRAALDAGVRIIFGSWFHESLSAGWSPATWREVFLPWLRAQVEITHAAGALYHFYDDGRMQAILPMLVEAGVDVVSTCTPPPVGDFDLAAAKESFGSDLCFKGYIDLLYTVKLGTTGIIDEAVRQAMEIGKPGGGFILGSSDSFRDGTPVENVRAYFDAARKYGTYGDGGKES